LKSAWADLAAAVRSNDKGRAEAALSAFRRTVAVSPDLIPKDGARLVKKAEQQMRAAFPRGLSPVGRTREGMDIGAMADLQLYD
jgi:hypothetical protein